MPFKFKETLYDDQESIDQIVHNNSSDALVTDMKDQIKFIKSIEFYDIFPGYIVKKANQSIAYAVEVFFNEFPELEAEHFPFERPLFKANISPEGCIYEVHCDTAKLTFASGTRRDHYNYELITLQNNEEKLSKEKLQDINLLKDKFVAIIDRKENVFRLMKTNYELDICPLVKPSHTEQRLMEEIVCAACHEEVHYLTMPMITKKLFTHDPDFDIKESGSLNWFTYISELTAYSMGTLFMNNFLDSNYHIDDFSKLNTPHTNKAREILSLSKGSLSRCNELIDEEIKKSLKLYLDNPSSA